MNDNLKLFKNGIILYLRLLITSIVGIFTSRFIIQSLGASDFGLYNVVGGIVFIMAFLNTAMTSTTYRYIAFELGKGNIDGVKKIFNISLVIHLFLAVLVVVLAFTLGEFYIRNYLNVSDNKVEDALFVFRFSVLGIFFSVISIPFQGLITAQEKFSVQATIEIIRSLLALTVAIVLIYYFGNRLRIYAILMSIVLFVPPLLFFLYSKKNYAVIVKWSFQRDKSMYREMISYSGWIMIGAGASIGKVQGAALIINSFFGTVLNASFGIANQVNSLVLIFAQNIGQVAVPQITKNFAGGNSVRSLDLVSYISKYTFFLMLLPALPLLLEIDYLLILWLGDVPIYTAIFCRLMIVNAIIDCLESGLPAAVQATGKIKYYQIILNSTSLVSLPIAYLFFKLGYPPHLIIYAYIVTATFNVVIRQILLKKLINFNVKYFIKTSYLRIFYVLLFVSPLFILQTFFPDGLTRFILLTIFSIIWLSIVIYQVGIEKKEKELFGKLIKDYRHFC